MLTLGIVYRDGDHALFWRLPSEGEAAPFLTGRNIFPGDYLTLTANKIAIVAVQQHGSDEVLQPLFTMALSQSSTDSPSLAKIIIPDLLRSPKGPEFVAMLRLEASTRLCLPEGASTDHTNSPPVGCPNCGGRGYRAMYPANGDPPRQEPCARCDGSGTI